MYCRYNAFQPLTDYRSMHRDIKAFLESKTPAEDSSGGLWHWDLESHHINWSNGFKAMLGLNIDWQVNREAWREMMHPDDRDTTVAKIKSYLEKKIDTYDHTYRIRHADGSWRWVHSQGKAAWNDEGRAVIIAGTIKDVTDTIDATNYNML